MPRTQPKNSSQNPRPPAPKKPAPPPKAAAALAKVRGLLDAGAVAEIL